MMRIDIEDLGNLFGIAFAVWVIIILGLVLDVLISSVIGHIVLAVLGYPKPDTTTTIWIGILIFNIPPIISGIVWLYVCRWRKNEQQKEND